MRPVKMVCRFSVRKRCNGEITWEALNKAKKKKWFRHFFALTPCVSDYELLVMNQLEPLVRNLLAMRHPALFPSKMFLRIIICMFYIISGNFKANQLPVGLLAQLVERCTGIAEVVGSNPVRVWIFFRSSLQLLLSVVFLAARIS